MVETQEGRFWQKVVAKAAALIGPKGSHGGRLEENFVWKGPRCLGFGASGEVRIFVRGRAGAIVVGWGRYGLQVPSGLALRVLTFANDGSQRITQDC